MILYVPKELPHKSFSKLFNNCNWTGECTSRSFLFYFIAHLFKFFSYQGSLWHYHHCMCPLLEFLATCRALHLHKMNTESNLSILSLQQWIRSISSACSMKYVYIIRWLEISVIAVNFERWRHDRRSAWEWRVSSSSRSKISKSYNNHRTQRRENNHSILPYKYICTYQQETTHDLYS